MLLRISTMTATYAIQLPGLDPYPPELTESLLASLQSQPEGYAPRTHHKNRDGTPQFTNRLIYSTSPYLLQHAHNPVNWHPWGEEAFKKAEALGRPILLSVGYSTCHWCHVMERESFEDLEIAEYINRYYVAVKVDREERPDVDSVYMMAVQMATGGGGWPMTVIMTPDGEPFFVGTYFPARDGDRGARVGFLTILTRIHEAWMNDREDVVADAQRLVHALRSATPSTTEDALPNTMNLAEAAHFLGRAFDPLWGGFHGPPKFPRPSTYELLLRYGHRSQDPAARHIVHLSLRKMSDGGMYDHVGGGFARYSTDREWLVPHFEKMLYDNAQLASLLVEAYQSLNDPTLVETLRETLDYVLREMTDREGGFFSATDADSEGVEGKFFTWTRGEIVEVLGEEQGTKLSEMYGVTREGNFEGTNILHLARNIDDYAPSINTSSVTLKKELKQSLKKLYDARSTRIHPSLDDKIITAWNAQMISALARAGFALAEPRYIEAARSAGAFILQNLRTQDGALYRAWRAGKHSGRSVLEDYAYLAAAMLDLFEATSEIKWLNASTSLTDFMITKFWDTKDGGFFGTSSDDKDLLVREKPGYDGAQPSGNSVAALTLLRLGALTTKAEYQQYADQTILAFGRLLKNGAVQNPKMAQALDWRLDKAKEILIVKTAADDGEQLVSLLRTTFVPNAVRLIVEESEIDKMKEAVPWVEGKKALGGRATAYVCLEGLCKLPTLDPETLRQQLKPEIPIDAPPLRLKEASKTTP